MKKRQHLRRVGAATKIQALARGIRGRKWMKKNRRRLIRERTARLKVETVLLSQCGISSPNGSRNCMYVCICSSNQERRLKACIRIQCFFRRVLARRAVGRRRKAKEAELNEQREWEELERSLDGLHGEFMLELMAIRLETGARGMVARK